MTIVLDQVVDLVLELANELEGELHARYDMESLKYPVMKRRFDRDMEPVHRARRFIREHDLERTKVSSQSPASIEKNPA